MNENNRYIFKSEMPLVYKELAKTLFSQTILLNEMELDCIDIKMNIIDIHRFIVNTTSKNKLWDVFRFEEQYMYKKTLSCLNEIEIEMKKNNEKFEVFADVRRIDPVFMNAFRAWAYTEKWSIISLEHYIWNNLSNILSYFGEETEYLISLETTNKGQFFLKSKNLERNTTKEYECNANPKTAFLLGFKPFLQHYKTVIR